MTRSKGTGRTGRPPELDKVVRVRADGTNETAGEVIVLSIRLGMEVEDAARAANVTKQTIYNWKREGAQAHEKWAAQGAKALSAKERRYADFVDAIERAYAEFEQVCLGVIHRAGDGGHRVTETRTVTRRTKAGEQVTEVTTTEKVSLPQWQAKAWLLERRRPALYRRRVELTGADGEPLVPPEKRADDLAASFERHLEAEASAKEAERARTVRNNRGPFPGD